MRRLVRMRLNSIASRRLVFSALSMLTAFLSVCEVDTYAQSGVPFYTKAQLGHAVAVQTANQGALLASDGVFGVGVGETNGSLAIAVFVDSTNRAAQLPPVLDDLPVSLRVLGPIHALACSGLNPRAAYPLPVPLGVSGGNAIPLTGGGCASGTIGFKVRDNLSGAIGWIGNNHVVGNGANLCPGTAPLGTPQYQPGPIDTTPACSIGQLVGTLSRFVPIDFSGADNLVDGGFVVSSDAAVSSEILNLGPQVNNVVPAFIGQVVQKNGRTTACTEGTVSAVNATVNIMYDGATCTLATFTNQVVVSPTAPSLAFAAAGDSGSPIVDANNNAVALLFAGNATTGDGIGNPIQGVLSALNVSLASFASSNVVTRNSRFWFTHGFSSETNCVTLLSAITFGGGVLDLGFVTLATANRNSDNVIDGTDAFIEALSFYYKGVKVTGEPNGTQSEKLPSSALCIARKQLAVELIAAYANTTLLGTFPPNATYVSGRTVTNFPADLISQARGAGAGFDITAIHTMTALLRKFNSSGLTNNLPNGLVECSPQTSRTLKPIARDPMMQDTCPGVNNTCLAAKTIVFSVANPVFKDSASIVGFPNTMPVPTCGVGGPNAVWEVSPPVAAAGRQFSVSTSGSNFDTLLAVWSGTCSNLTEVGCADNVVGTGGETLTFTTDGINMFFIVVEGKAGEVGKVKMSVQSF